MAQQSEEPGLPTTGREVPELRAFDHAVRSLMAEHGIPGASLAVAREGRLVLARGYGFADTASREPVRPSHRFRIASVTKPITAAAILELVERGRLRLDDRPFEILDRLAPPGGPADPRMREITVRQLLRHRGGFDRRRSIDPTLVPGAVAESLGVEQPIDVGQVVRFMLGRPLDFEPGARTAYSNFGYAVLGRLVEEVTGRRYEAFVREAVLEPAGAEGIEVGRSFPADRPDDEVSYHHPGPPGPVPAIPPAEGRVALPDGGFRLELMAAHGGLIATPADLLRFLTAVDGEASRPDVLSPATVRRMTAPPEGVRPDSAYYAMGWNVRPPTGDAPATWWHGGDLPGTAALLMRSGPTAWAFVINRSPWGREAHGTIRRALERAARAVTSWPEHDLFDRSRAPGTGADGGGRDVDLP